MSGMRIISRLDLPAYSVQFSPVHPEAGAIGQNPPPRAVLSRGEARGSVLGGLDFGDKNAIGPKIEHLLNLGRVALEYTNRRLRSGGLRGADVLEDGAYAERAVLSVDADEVVTDLAANGGP